MKKMIMVFFTVLSLLVTGCQSNAKPESDTGTDSTELAPGEENVGLFTAYPKDGVIEAPTFGMKITLPKSLQDYPLVLFGFVQPHYAYGRLSLLNEDNVSDSTDIIQFLAYPEQATEAQISSESDGLTVDMVRSLGTNETLYYYGINLNDIYQVNPEPFDAFFDKLKTDEEKETYAYLLEHGEEVFDGIELTDLVLPKMPEAQDVETNSLLEMKVLDMDGNEVRLGDYIENNQVTMLNFWGTECAPCVQEMPWLQQLYDKYKDQGFAVVGICTDIIDDNGEVQQDVLESAKDIIDHTGVSYPILVPSREVLDLVQLPCTPTSFFIDSNGNKIVDPVLGSKAEDQWEQIIQDCMEKNK